MRFQTNPDMDAPQRHRLLNPHLHVPAMMPRSDKWVAGTIGLILMPDTLGFGDGAPLVKFSGGPHRWMNQHDTYMPFDTPLARLREILDARRDAKLFAGSATERHGKRAMTLAPVSFRPARLFGLRGRARTLLSLTIGSQSENGVLSWEQPDSYAARGWFGRSVLVDFADLASALNRLNAAAEQAEAIKVPYEQFMTG